MGAGQHLTGGRAACLGVKNPDGPRRLSEGRRRCMCEPPLDRHIRPRLLPLTSVALEEETGAADVWRLAGRWFPHWRRNITDPSHADKQKQKKNALKLSF